MFAQSKPEQKQTTKDTVQKKEIENKSATNLTGIPNDMKTRFENLSGFSFDDVCVHYNSGKPAQLQALAYTQGNQVYVAPGQEKHLGHELGHVVQQKQGRVKTTPNVNGIDINDDIKLEKEADNIINSVHDDDKTIEGSCGANPNVVQRIKILIDNENVLFANMRKIDIPKMGEQGITVKHEDDQLPALIIGETESIIFEGHGVKNARGKVVMQGRFNPVQIAGIAHRIVKPDDWSGKIILVGCQTGDIIRAVAERYNTLSGKTVNVVGTKENIKVGLDKKGKYFAGYVSKGDSTFKDLAAMTEVLRDLIAKIVDRMSSLGLDRMSSLGLDRMSSLKREELEGFCETADEHIRSMSALDRDNHRLPLIGTSIVNIRFLILKIKANEPLSPVDPIAIDIYARMIKSLKNMMPHIKYLTEYYTSQILDRIDFDNTDDTIHTDSAIHGE